MYTPPQFREERREVLHAVIGARPLATIVIASGDGFEVNHVPCLIEPQEAAPGILYAHVSRANPLVRLAKSAVPAVAIFSAAEGYISPSWYPAKAVDGRVVPTWNYIIVHAHGTLTAIDHIEWVREQTATLTSRMESGRAVPWRPADAPADYIESQLRGIVGIEFVIERLEGKWKLGQNRSEADRLGMASALEAEPHGLQTSLAEEIRKALEESRGRQ